MYDKKQHFGTAVMHFAAANGVSDSEFDVVAAGDDVSISRWESAVPRPSDSDIESFYTEKKQLDDQNLETISKLGKLDSLVDRSKEDASAEFGLPLSQEDEAVVQLKRELRLLIVK